MLHGGLSILDGKLLREADLSAPPRLPEGVIACAEVLQLAENRASLSLHGVVLPETLKSAALLRLGFSDAAAFRTKELDYSDASLTFRNYVSAIADELRDDPIAVANLDGKTLQMFLEDEDDFAMLAENLFTDLDTEDRGKISKDEIQSALIHMGIELGIPPVSGTGQKEKKNLTSTICGAVTCATRTGPILAKPVVVVKHIKIVNGSKLRKRLNIFFLTILQLVTDERQLDDVVKKIMQEKYESKSEWSSTMKVRHFLEKHGNDFGLPPPELDETVVLFDDIFSEVESQNDAAESEKDGFMVLLKKILENFAEKLEANPILYDLHSSQLKEAAMVKGNTRLDRIDPAENKVDPRNRAGIIDCSCSEGSERHGLNRGVGLRISLAAMKPTLKGRSGTFQLEDLEIGHQGSYGDLH
ncbi:hypothetical protein Sango_0660400 [Sesamum angolense]|uniref:EF-hand domain-containing protein n=1 Tax=Sesamum angolense TaxID=2727404 RepID=A0AAE1X740_9LAMI|nr:hypothetical protein Sango_0660400 [Sesamum angolense]